MTDNSNIPTSFNAIRQLVTDGGTAETDIYNIAVWASAISDKLTNGGNFEDGKFVLSGPETEVLTLMAGQLHECGQRLQAWFQDLFRAVNKQAKTTAARNEGDAEVSHRGHDVTEVDRFDDICSGFDLCLLAAHGEAALGSQRRSPLIDGLQERIDELREFGDELFGREEADDTDAELEPA